MILDKPLSLEPVVNSVDGSVTSSVWCLAGASVRNSVWEEFIISVGNSAVFSAVNSVENHDFG